MKSLSVLLSSLLLCFTASAQDASPRWEYFVIAQDDAISSIAETGQEAAYKAWLSANRPDAHKKIAELEAQDAAADNARKKIKSIISNVSNSHVTATAALDYYLNMRGKEGWELITRHDGTLIFKRPQR